MASLWDEDHFQRPLRSSPCPCQAATMSKYPSPPVAWGTLDGLNLNIQSTKDDKVQLIFYNGLMLGHYISSVFIFGMDGLFRICGLNAPGTMHDGTTRNGRQFLAKPEARL
jgi:hypothetical protein